MTFGIYTCCNSRMLPFFHSWRRAVEVFNPGTPVAVIPFDDDSDDLRRLTLSAGYEWVDEPAKTWRELGVSVYGTETYRQGIPRANYFSKLAAFNGPFDKFVYADVNSLLLMNVAAEFRNEELKGSYFWFQSRPRRNYGSASALAIYRRLEQEFKHGYNACFFAGTQDYVTVDMAREALAHREYYDGLFGPAPEQSMLSWLKVTNGLEFRRVGELKPQLTYALDSHDVRWEQGQLLNTAGRRVHFMKWTGQRFDEGMSNYWLLDALAQKRI